MKSQVSTAARKAIGTRPVASVLQSVLRTSYVGGNLLTVLTYHRVAPASPSATPGILSAEPDELDRHMAFVSAEFNLISADDLVAASQGAALPPRALHVTFDDGYHDFAEHAWPILKRHRVPTTLFVPTDYPDSGKSFWWDRLYLSIANTNQRHLDHDGTTFPLTDHADRVVAYRTLGSVIKETAHDPAMALVDKIVEQLDADINPPTVLGWQDLANLRDDGLTIAPHSHTHPLFDRIDQDRLRQELELPRRILAEQLKVSSNVLAYPGGHWSEGVAAATAAAGYAVTFTTERGVNRWPDCDWMALRRINVGVRTDAPLIRAQATYFGLVA